LHVLDSLIDVCPQRRSNSSPAASEQVKGVHWISDGLSEISTTAF